MRFAAFSDIHGDHRSLSEILDLVKPEGVDFLVFAGDMTDDGRGIGIHIGAALSPNDIARFAMQSGDEAKAV